MNRNKFDGNWHVLRGKVREQWGRLTDDDLDVIDGQYEQLVGKIQQRYGMKQDEVERDIDQWMNMVEVENRPRRGDRR